MSHFAAGQPASNITPSLLSTASISDYAAKATDSMMAYYSADVDMKTLATVLLFTTEASRGYFVPLFVNIAVAKGYNTVAATAPVVSLGFEAGNSYNNWLSNQGLTAISSAFYSGQWAKGSNSDTQGIQLLINQFARACPPSTGVYLRISGASTATIDNRVVSVFGYYAG